MENIYLTIPKSHRDYIKKRVINSHKHNEFLERSQVEKNLIPHLNHIHHSLWRVDHKGNLNVCHMARMITIGNFAKIGKLYYEVDNLSQIVNSILRNKRKARIVKRVKGFLLTPKFIYVRAKNKIKYLNFKIIIFKNYRRE